MMLKKSILSFSLTALLCGLVGCGSSSDSTTVYVQSVNSGSFDGDRLIVQSNPQVIYFSGSLDEGRGQLNLPQFEAIWGDSGYKIESEPPKVIISIYNATGQSPQTTALLRSPKFQGDTVTYEAEVIEGNLPSNFGNAALFIEMPKVTKLF